jgi:hypothetical protein
MHSGQPLMSARDTTLPRFFDIPQELPQQLRIGIGDNKIVHFSVEVGGCIDDQQAYGIAIASLRIATASPLPWKMISSRCCQLAGTPLGSKAPVHQARIVDLIGGDVRGSWLTLSGLIRIS